jgi:hypothetical protein
MNAPASGESLIAVGRRHWRSYLPMWLFPIAFFGGIFLPWRPTHSIVFFFLFWFPLAGLCFWPATTPRRAGLATFWQSFFWACIVPFVIWTLIAGGIFGLAFVFNAV